MVVVRVRRSQDESQTRGNLLSWQLAGKTTSSRPAPFVARLPSQLTSRPGARSSCELGLLPASIKPRQPFSFIRMTTSPATFRCNRPLPCAAEAGGFLVKQKARQQKPRQPKPAAAEQDDAPEGGGESGSPNKDAHGEDAGGSGVHRRLHLLATSYAAGDMPPPSLPLWGHGLQSALRGASLMCRVCCVHSEAACRQPVWPYQSCTTTHAEARVFKHQHVMASLHALLLLHTCSPTMGQVRHVYSTLSNTADHCAHADGARTKEGTPPSSTSPAASLVNSQAGTSAGCKHNPFEEADAEEVGTS